MHKRDPVFRFKFDTIRDLERKGFRVFYVAGAVSFIGLLLIFLIPPLGIALLMLGLIGLIAAMVWMSGLQREPVKHLFCPYCASKNDVFASRTEFDCDICQRRVGLSETGEPIPLEPVEYDD